MLPHSIMTEIITTEGIVLDEISLFADSLSRITQACNVYYSNQIPKHALAVVNEAQSAVDRFITSCDENITQIIHTLHVTLHKPFTHETEGAIIQEIRTISDIIRPNNLVLSYKNPL